MLLKYFHSANDIYIYIYNVRVTENNSCEKKAESQIHIIQSYNLQRCISENLAYDIGGYITLHIRVFDQMYIIMRK